MNRNKSARLQISESLKALLKVFLLVASIGLPYYFRFVLGMEVAVVDLLYTPVILIVLWWPTAGILVALSLSLLLLISHIFFEPATPLFHDLQRSLALYAIAMVMNILSRQAKDAEQEARQRSEELSALNAIAAAASQSLDLDEILEVSFDKVLETMRARAGGIYLLDEKGRKLVAKVYRRISPQFVEEAMKLDDGPARQALQSGEPVMIADLSEKPELVQMMAQREKFQSYASVPLKSKEKVLGVMDVITHRSHLFTLRDVALLTAIGDQMGVAIENARLFEDVQQRVQELADLSEASRAITSSLDLEEVLTKIVSLAGGVVYSTATSVVLVEENGSFSLSIDEPKDAPPVSHRARLHGITRQIVATGKPVIINEIFQDGTTRPPIAGDEGPIKANPALLEAGIRSGAGIPIISKGQVLGVLFVCSPHPYAFEGRLPLLAAFANQAAIAIENARLFGELGKWGSELEARVEERTRELEETQEKLIRAERLAAIGQLGATVGHELRNPLGVINNSVYYLKTKLEDADGKVQRHLNIIEREVARSNKIISGLLSFARVKTPQLKEVQINALVEEALLRSFVPDNVIVVTSLEDSLPPLMVDPDQIEQVFLNLILNAVEAMPDGGKLEIATKAEDRFIVAQFKDHGCGIAEESLETLFEPLFTTKAKGIGLGLAASKQIIETHGGSIEVASQLGKGSTFRVRLPI